ncbi:3-phosphoshikimate 1-carboxyvinyltransferase [Salinimicrobium tongyeongense]|uniref:3-phosphoshikimate 1-carboxyvinyltransferase n=1 Tax=Salinimicrobium tongyeongense TaxID=2809707 RepID=A0ABY6NT93_9FLAO|nr:3-phosphoshikimate 1-carboxyvinyltransferase [Salinimicrobium tongyeongense]UZH56129.1 3-phosphoshikimate 1-carboxyvinyltransferase [Salinimicrobium tongyeongense]
MPLHLSTNTRRLSGKIAVTGSKSESNRLLILQALYPHLEIDNLSNSDDTRVLQKALNSEDEVIDIHHAGTAMRFLTAYFVSKEGRETVLTGSPRMQERPIAILVDALRDLGADITYDKNEGFPPLRIKGKKLLKNEVKMQANVSSQYISALMLIAPSLPKGLKIDLEGKITSVPYIQMSLQLLKQCGIEGSFENNQISIAPTATVPAKRIVVESDWSSASYFYSMAALSDAAELSLTAYRENSLQGDRSVADIYQKLGVKTTFLEGKIRLEKLDVQLPEVLELDLANSPDLAQTIAVTCFGLGVKAYLTGLHTLRIKETDRLQALKNEIEKLGGQVEITDDTLKLSASEEIKSDIAIDTYNDHRMALAFAPLALKVPLVINDAGVVSKSFPEFWENLQQLKFSVKDSAKE